MHDDEEGYTSENEEPTEGDVTTHDHERFYQYDKLWLQVPAGVSRAVMWKRIDAKMKHEGFFPTIWFISDHGNAHVMERLKRKGGSHYAKERKQRGRDAEANRIIARAEKKYGTHGSLISGGFYSHWPERVKDQIRKLRHGR
jgi:hypothetical protein